MSYEEEVNKLRNKSYITINNERKELERKWREVIPECAVKLILSRKKNESPYEVKPHMGMIGNITDTERDKVLDFGAGVGRNTYGLIKVCDEVWAYDFPNMIDTIKNNPKFKDSGIVAASDWNKVRKEKFTAIFAIISLQNIHLYDVRNYLKDFVAMSDHLYVQTRNWSAYKHISMYDILTEYWELDTDTKFKSIDEAAFKSASGSSHYFVKLRPKGSVRNKIIEEVTMEIENDNKDVEDNEEDNSKGRIYSVFNKFMNRS